MLNCWMGLRGKSCHCVPQLGHRVTELPALVSHAVPAFVPGTKLKLAAGDEFPKCSSQEQLLSAGLLSGTAVICLLGPISLLAR